MRDQILFFLNGQRVEVSGRAAFSMLAPWLRRERELTGTKIACAHGACGSCSVLLGRPSAQGEIDYQVVNSCIHPVFACDGAHIISVEGLNGPNHIGGQDDGFLSPVQSAMVYCHGAQCGFCTPGVVVTLTAFHQRNTSSQTNFRAQIVEALEGNLCRCTGYSPIIDAGTSVKSAALTPLSELYPPETLSVELKLGSEDAALISVAGDELEGEQQVFLPRSIKAAATWKAAHPEAVVIAGATEIGVEMSVKGAAPREILSLTRVEDLQEVDVDNGVLILGARANWTRVAQEIREIVPEFSEFLSHWGSPQLRNAGTIGGSILSASPISDSLPFLLVCEAQLEFWGENGARRVAVAEFLGGKAVAHRGEILRRVLVPLPRENQRLRLFKVSKRRAFDRSLVSAAFLISLKNGEIENVKIAMGGVAPRALRLPQTEAFLQGKRLENATWHEAGVIAQSEVAPISDSAASREYRLQLVGGLLRKFGSEIE